MTQTNPVVRWSVVFSGQVQGVGFRYNATRIARSMGVRGYVRNVPDGRVELVAEALEQELTQLIDEICQTTHGYIRETNVNKQEATHEFTDFDVRH